MPTKSYKPVIRLKVNDLMKAAIDKKLTNDTKIAAALGVSVTQIWRTKLPVDHQHYSAPGTTFIAGVMDVFEAPFERFFFLDSELQGRNHIEKKAVGK